MAQIDAHLDAARTEVAAALRVLLSDSIDYAGTFPPASLPLDEAVRNYVRYRKRGDAWILARFVCPAGRLDEMRAYQDRFEAASPFRFSILVGDGSRPGALLSSLVSQMRGVADFASASGDAIRIESMELKMPGSVLSTDVITIRHLIDDVVEAVRAVDLSPADIFFEVPLDENVNQTIPMVTGAVHAFNREESGADRPHAGIKLRMGGAGPADVPSVQSLTLAISACCSAGVRFKATAGLHHPLRHRDASLNDERHGFLNLFAASVFGLSGGCDEAQMMGILSETSAAAFSFDEDGLSWDGNRANIEAIERARRRLIVSFGSCSFEEPIDDLRTLGLI